MMLHSYSKIFRSSSNIHIRFIKEGERVKKNYKNKANIHDYEFWWKSPKLDIKKKNSKIVW